jgi:hypothetical protein
VEVTLGPQPLVDSGLGLHFSVELLHTTLFDQLAKTTIECVIIKLFKAFTEAKDR